jgi:hypothetical protein
LAFSPGDRYSVNAQCTASCTDSTCPIYISFTALCEDN